MPSAPAEPQRHGRVAFLPFGPWSIKVPKLLGFIGHPVTLGDHLKRRRALTKLVQKDVATILDVSPFTYRLWEQDVHMPHISYWPVIIQFLTYHPILTLGIKANWILEKRRELGLTIKGAAQHLRIDEQTFGRIERGKMVNGQNTKYSDIVSQFRNLEIKQNIKR